MIMPKKTMVLIQESSVPNVRKRAQCLLVNLNLKKERKKEKSNKKNKQF